MNTPADWSMAETRLYDDVAYAVPELHNDRMAQALYDTALFNMDISKSDRAAVIGALKDYLRDEYGVDWDAVFDWEGYRENYDRA